MNAASRFAIEVAHQEIADKIATAERHHQRRDARATRRAAQSTRPARYGWVWLRFTSRHA